MRRVLSRWLIEPAVVGTAMGVGGLAATAATGGNPLAGVAGAAAMYPPAKTAVHGINQMLGISGREKPSESEGQQIKRSFKEFGQGLEIEAVGKILGLAPDVTKGAVKNMVPALFGPSKEAVAARIAAPGIIRNAPSYLELAQKVPYSLKKISGAIKFHENDAASYLRNSPMEEEGAVPVSYLTQIMGNIQNGLKVGSANIGVSDKSATARMDALIRDLENIVPRKTPEGIIGPNGQPIILKPAEAYIPETTLRKAIQRIRKDINFDDKSATVANSVLTDASTKLDAILKAGNPDYQRAMRPVNVLTRVYNDVLDKLSLTRKTGEGAQPSDATISIMKSLPAERKGITQKVLRRVKTVTGEDYTLDAKNRALREQFVGGATQGSRRVYGIGGIGTGLGAALGYLVGHPKVGATIGGQAGIIAGMISDITGREIGANVVDTYLRMQPGLAKLPYEAAARVIGSMIMSDANK